MPLVWCDDGMELMLLTDHPVRLSAQRDLFRREYQSHPWTSKQKVQITEKNWEREKVTLIKREKLQF